MHNDTVFAQQLRAATHRLRTAAAETRLGGAIARLAALLDLRYRPDQARAPRGTREGGQFIDEGRRRGVSRKRVAEVGERVLSWKGPNLSVISIYKFQRFMVQIDMGQRIAPPSLLHSSPLVQAGRLLNDNQGKDD